VPTSRFAAASDRSYSVSVRYRVDDLAARCDVSVDTVRYYQSKGLLPRPEREGRLAWYGEEHVERLERVRELKAQGFSLAMIGRVLRGELDTAEQALALALVRPDPGAGAVTRLTTEELAERTGVPATLLEALAREGLLNPTGDEDDPRYDPDDAEVVRAGLALLEAGVPLSELLDLARRHDAAMRATAEHAVDLFARFVRDPARAEARDESEVAERTVGALHAMLPATSTLVAHHFRRQLLDAARARLEDSPGVLEAGGNRGAGGEPDDETGTGTGDEAEGEPRAAGGAG
jgi:DNA-binding transcriptional MerR regulator